MNEKELEELTSGKSLTANSLIYFPKQSITSDDSIYLHKQSQTSEDSIFVREETTSIDSFEKSLRQKL
ncbi:MAG: hypothetical protein PHW96_02945 [Candidatus Nanoarchaeia archaeon]|nr:hypothetical protein [Candidatus Nanoarchaeia archaeon]